MSIPGLRYADDTTIFGLTIEAVEGAARAHVQKLFSAARLEMEPSKTEALVISRGSMADLRQGFAKVAGRYVPLGHTLNILGMELMSNATLTRPFNEQVFTHYKKKVATLALKAKTGFLSTRCYTLLSRCSSHTLSMVASWPRRARQWWQA